MSSSVSIGGESREAVLLQIVVMIAFGEGKTTTSGSTHILPNHFSREWLLGAFATARECIDGKTHSVAP